MRPHHHYRGWKSTKLHLALITMVILTVVYGIIGFPEAAFSQWSMALITAAGIYSASAAAEKFTTPQPPRPDEPAGPL